LTGNEISRVKQSLKEMIKDYNDRNRQYMTSVTRGKIALCEAIIFLLNDYEKRRREER
jgi:hypothetical protein